MRKGNRFFFQERDRMIHRHVSVPCIFQLTVPSPASLIIIITSSIHSVTEECACTHRNIHGYSTVTQHGSKLHSALLVGGGGVTRRPKRHLYKRLDWHFAFFAIDGSTAVNPSTSAREMFNACVGRACLYRGV